MNLCDDEIEDDREIASEENNEDNEEESENSANILVCKPNTKSVVWSYFSIKAGEDGVPLRDEMDKPICTLCKKIVPAKRSNTTNLFKHLQEHHAEVYAKIASKNNYSRPMQKRQLSLLESLEVTKPYNSNSKRAEELTLAVTKFIALDMQPFYIVERKGFREMLQMFDPKYKLPSRKHFVDVEIPKLFTEMKCKVLHCLSDHVEYFAATTDLWTSAASHPYLNFTVHFINKDWKLQCFCLDTIPLFSDHTGQNIADAIQDILLNWILESGNLLITTTDNGSNFVAAFHNILAWPRLSCFGHNLDLAIAGRKLEILGKGSKN